MNECEVILTENEILKLLKTSNEICKKIYEFIQTDYSINNLCISISNIDNEKILFEKISLNSNFNKTFKFKQNKNTYINLKLIAFNEEKYNFLLENEKDINLKLQLFAQTLYNKFLEESISKLSLIDNVTGLYNRTYLDNYVSNILSLSKRENKKVAFLKISVDHFKAVIEEFDYTVGDEVLRALGKVLKDSVRTSDIVIKLNSEEFLVILLNIINDDNAIMISNKLISNFSKEKVLVNKKTGQTLMKTICSGICIYPDDGLTISDILKKADIALDEAKNQGRSKTFKYNEEETNTIDLF